jgi:hypothetical protein
MGARRPLVGTGIGLAGLGVVDGVHALVRDDARGFADAVVSLLGHGGDVGTQVKSAAELADRHDWGVLGERFARAVVG